MFFALIVTDPHDLVVDMKLTVFSDENDLAFRKHRTEHAAMLDQLGFRAGRVDLSRTQTVVQLDLHRHVPQFFFIQRGNRRSGGNERAFGFHQLF